MRILFLLLLILCFSCEKQLEPCLGVRCNNGYCDDGDCFCNVSYTGINCEEQKTPSKMIFRRVIFFNLPSVRPDSSTWDLDGTIDPYLLIKDGSRELYRTEYERDVTNFQYFSYFMYLRILQVENQLSLHIVDNDLHEEEIICEFSFLPYTKDNGFPEQLKFEDERGTKLLIEVMYEF